MSNLHPYNFFFDLPLYTKIKVDSSNTNEFYQLMRFGGGIHAYNPILKENTTYKVYLDKYISGGKS